MHNVFPNYIFLLIPAGALIAFLTSLTVFFNPRSERYLKYFSYFLFVNFLLDTATSYTAFYRMNNIFLNNLQTLLVISFEIYLLREIIASRKAKKVFLYALVLYPIVAILNIALVQRVRNFHTMTYSLGNLLIVAGCIYYFWELFQQKTSVNLIREPAFWICSGLLFYYCCTFTLYGLTNFIMTLPKVVLLTLLKILIIMNIIEYLSFIIAFLCRLKITRSMSTS